MKCYQDKETGLWKIGSNGKPQYESEKAAKRAALDSIVNKILDLKRRRQQALQ